MKKIYGILCILLCFFAAGCDDDSNDDARPRFEITERVVNISAGGGTVTVTLSMDATGAKSNQDWCTAAVSGKKVTVTLAANQELEGRTAVVTVTDGQESLSFPVTQIGNMIPTAEITNVKFDAKGGTQKIYVYHGSDFTATPADDWVTASVDGDSLLLTAQLNATVDPKTTTVKLSSGNLESEITVSQTGMVLIPEKKIVNLRNAANEVKLKVNSTLEFTAESSAAWLTVTAGADFITLAATDNTGQPARTATVTLASEGLTAEIEVSQSAYADYLGNWVLTGEDNGQPFTYDLAITEKEAGSTYKISGWGKSVVATDAKYAITANFDAAGGLIFIAAQQNIGAYTDAGGTYDLHFYGNILFNGGISYVTGTGYIIYIGELQADGSVQWSNGSVTLSGGGKYEVIGGQYRMKSRTDGKVYSFNVDRPFMREPVMKKAAGAASVKNTPKAAVLTVEKNRLEAR